MLIVIEVIWRKPSLRNLFIAEPKYNYTSERSCKQLHYFHGM